VGSQVFDSDTFLRSAEIMLRFIDEIRKEFGYTARQLDLGGGYGVRYVESDPTIDIAANIR
jgi:diaminopimelate decarboxylase